MNKLFLYRLFKTSKLFFVAIVVFVSLYCITLSKQMDMLFFPLNSMFSQSAGKISPFTYTLKINNNPVDITHSFYLKKDFSESALYNFAKWISTNHQNFMTGYLNQKISDSLKLSHFLNILTPDKSVDKSWPKWFIQFNNKTYKQGDTISILKYNFEPSKNEMLLLDSLLIYKFIVNE